MRHAHSPSWLVGGFPLARRHPRGCAAGHDHWLIGWAARAAAMAIR
eukprot:CAMPEP_0119421962 /NCGR_PEP_ID=MMETSP1335-20130426/27101_1 /TAXON_ID=259385 /ORGANISM="Chrysoculter rhomboideus, Strain RCC1486" /LENGTH=45 /DNA_ID= /DNA_START= /DNA_END= /DNA_ORIENTATION=